MNHKFSQISKDFKFDHIKLSSDQEFVFAGIIDWLHTLPSPYLTVGGYAGTGKTTLISLLRKKIHQSHPNLKIGFASFIGKASENLRGKLVIAKAIYKGDSCGTIHRLMYKAETNGKGEIINWLRIDEIKKDLIIIDEASMLTAKIWSDLLSYQIPIIAFGDHGQLPPIGDDFNLMENLHLKLEKIHRQSEGNHIISLATKARLGEKIEVKNYDAKIKKISKKSPESGEFCDSFFAQFDDDSLVLVGTNKSRIQINHAIRTAKEIFSTEPVAGDKVVCLKNIYDNPSGDIFNGMTGVIESIAPHKKHWYLVHIIFPQEDRAYQGKISKYQFDHPTPIRSVRGVKREEIGELFDFGYALTVHKAQGSEAKRVLIIDESFLFNRDGDDQSKKWLYTAITRAQEELCILGY